MIMLYEMGGRGKQWEGMRNNKDQVIKCTLLEEAWAKATLIDEMRRNRRGRNGNRERK